MTHPRNAPASVRQRLLNRSRSERRPFNELLQYFAMERFLWKAKSDELDRTWSMDLNPIWIQEREADQETVAAAPGRHQLQP